MRRALLLTSLALACPTLALADSGAPPVIGGSNAPAGKWPDVVAVLFDGQQGCTGTLIHPKWVLSAGHCDDPSITGVLIGTSSLSRPSEGEEIDVVRRIPYPNSWNTFDVLLLELATPSSRAPRTIASGWARHDIVDGAEAALVGYGAIDRDSNQYIDELQEATSSITDANCDNNQGCNTGARPDGELGAGGDGIDTCLGDSGGPLYLVTDYGTFLAGVTSRGYDDNQFECSEGGVYARPDAIVDWIEQQIGEQLPEAPSAVPEVLVAETGEQGRARVDPADPRDGATHTYSISGAPAQGIATIDANGVVTYQSVDDFIGTDEIEIEVADAENPDRFVRTIMQVEVVENTGCCQAGSGRGTAAPVVVVLAFMLWPRRRRHA